MTDIWTAAPWAEKPGQGPAFPAQPPCTTIVKPVRPTGTPPPVRRALYASMRNAQGFGMILVGPRIVRIIVTSAADEGLLFSDGENEAADILPLRLPF